MSRQTIEREIERLETLGRARALSAGESIQLDNLVKTKRAYDRMCAARRRAAAVSLRVARKEG